MPLCREAVLGPAFAPGSLLRPPRTVTDSPAVSPPKAARRRAIGRHNASLPMDPS
jgi:hypothetical protein